jgi:hypothetical protein
MDFYNFSTAEKNRWLQLRAIEWSGMPSFITQPIVPIMFIFYPPYLVVLTVIGIGLLWCLVRYSFISVNIANALIYPVFILKWPAAIGSCIYLFINNHPIVAILALSWPFLSGITCPPGKIGVIELAFAEKLGYVKPQPNMVLQVGQYTLTQPVTETDGLTEFTTKEYTEAESTGMLRMLDDEKFYHGIPEVRFSLTPWDETTIGATKGKKYKICLQKMTTNSKLAETYLQTTVQYVNELAGKYNEHPLFSKKFIWDREQGNIILYMIKGMGWYSVNIFFTSNIIREQIQKLQS